MLYRIAALKQFSGKHLHTCDREVFNEFEALDLQLY